MIDNFTLQGNPEGLIYRYQPGFRYILALEILIFGDENRLMQILNVFIYLSLFFYFWHKIFENNLSTKNTYLSVLVFLSLPFIINNILFFLSSWFVVFLFILSSIMYLNKKYLFFSILLAFIPFIRQNLLLVVILIFSFHLIEYYYHSKKLIFIEIMAFIFVLLLPFFHNVFYANSFSYFTSWTGVKLALDENESIFRFFNMHWLINNYQNIFNHIVFYRLEEIFLLDTKGNSNYSFKYIIISLFVPLMIFYILFKFTRIISIYYKFIYLLVILFSFGPTLVLASLYFPRHEYMSIYISLIFYLVFIPYKYKLK